MDPEEATDPQRRAPAAKKSLDQFLAEFEARLRDYPGEPATSATAALEGRAEGAWRTPVEGAEAVSRRLPRPALAPAPAIDRPEDPTDDPQPDPAPPGPGEAPLGAAAPPAAAPPPPPMAAAKRRPRQRRHHRHR